MKAFKKISLLLSFVALATVSAFAISTTKVADAAALKGNATGYTKASDVVYQKSGKYVKNWGARDEACTFLTSYAEDFYTGSYTFDQLSTQAGGTSQSNAYQSVLYSSLKQLMSSKQTYQTSYSATRDLFCYTDCVNSNSNYISSFYSAKQISGTWDGGSTWNREHTWPNSKGDGNGNGENDIIMLRPTSVSENSSRGNKAYGESSSYYDPNELGQNVRGDCARTMLYVYTRWANEDSAKNYMWGTSGVIENLNVLLKWMQEDPVDTWEMGRNDAVQAITGTRNVFVDYPEYAWMLFGKEIPSNMSTPSGIASGGTYVPPAGGSGSGSGEDITPEDPASPEQILNDLYALSSGSSLQGSFTLTGVITALDNYNNPTIVVGNMTDKPVYCYKLKDDRFVVGATITVTATTMKNYEGTYEFMNCTLDSIVLPGESTNPESSEIPESSEAPESSEVVETPVESALVEGVAYTVSANNANGTLYLIGTITGGRFDCSFTAADAVSVYVENVAGGQLLYMNVNGTKTYFIFEDKSAGGSTTTDASAATVFEWNATLKTLEVADDDNARAFGAQATSTYKNFSSYAVSNTEGYNWGQFTAVSGEAPETSEPEVSVPETSEAPESSEAPEVSVPETSEEPESSEVVETPVESALVEGVAYTVSANNANGTLYLIGTITGGRFDCSFTATDAVSVYVENVAGGQLLYMNVNGTKTYFIFEDKSAGGSTTTDASAATVFEWNATLKTLEVADDDNARAFGAQATSTYKNFSSYAVSNTEGYNWGQFTAVDGEAPETSEPEVSVPETSEAPESSEEPEVSIPESSETPEVSLPETSEEPESSEIPEVSESIETIEPEKSESSEEIESSEAPETSEPEVSVPESSEEPEVSEPTATIEPEKSESSEEIIESNEEIQSSEEKVSSETTSVPATSEETSSQPKEETSGCGSSVGASMAALVFAAGACLLVKKSKKEE